jgi:hypothetical protein
MLEVEIQVRAERSTLLLPTVLVGSSSHALDDPETFRNSVCLAVPDIQLQLRLHDYYMGAFSEYFTLPSTLIYFPRNVSEFGQNYGEHPSRRERTF